MTDKETTSTSNDSVTKVRIINKGAYIIFILLAAFIISPFTAITGASEYWKILYGTKRMGAINWIVSLPTPLVNFVMLKAESAFSLKTRFLVCWFTQIPVSVLVICISHFYKLDRNSNGNGYFAGFIIVVFLSSTLFAIAQASFFSFCSLFPNNYINSAPTGMSVFSLLSALLWLLLWGVLGEENSLALLLIYNGLVIVAMALCIFLFLWLSKMPFSQKYHSAEKKEIVRFCELKAAYKKIWHFSLQIYILKAVASFLMPTLCFGYKPGISLFANNWGSVLLFGNYFFNAFSRVFIHMRIKCFRLIFSQKRLKWVLAANCVVSLAVLVPLWLFQTGNLGVEPKSSVWIDVTVFVVHSVKSFVGGYLFNVYMTCSMAASDQTEKQRTSVLMTMSFVMGNFSGMLSSFCLNLLNK